MVPCVEGERKNVFSHVWEVLVTLTTKHFWLLKQLFFISLRALFCVYLGRENLLPNFPDGSQLGTF